MTPPSAPSSAPSAPSFVTEVAAQVRLSRTQLADGLARGDESLVESATARLAELDELVALHRP